MHFDGHTCYGWEADVCSRWARDTVQSPPPPSLRPCRFKLFTYTVFAVVALLLRQGEPGVGKTLFVEECGREWQREGVQVGPSCM